MDKIIEKNPKIKQRILQFIDVKGITKTDFCKRTGISYGNIKGNANKSELGGEQISIILEVFPEISPEWLLLGNGEMLRNAALNLGHGQQIVTQNNNGTINADNRQFYSDSPDVLRAQIEVLDERIKEKDAQIKEKDAQIKELHALLNKMVEKN